MIAQADGILIDWDGCIALANRPQAKALAFLARHRERIAIVSNNSTHLPEDFARIMARAGVPIPPERIILAGMEAIRHAATLGGRAMLLASQRLRAEALSLGLTLSRGETDLVVLLRDTRFTYAKLERATNALRNGARLILANDDLNHPGPHGRIVPETGALLAALEAAVRPAEIATDRIGKPAATLFCRAFDALAVDPRRSVMIGDNPDTDIAGAAALGMDAVLVGPRSGIGLGDLLD
ncbi:HAD family hydrolase [Sphingomonas oleivorans]|uniref:HAD family hydrolase n=2 Tax=Sphingomonas oleivorans TaxID=1735121 RepID=A0A2T5FV66_9SPHN|nr:HAD family hydrolase [Sphingomonas oleivorans]